jgi:hypothetical protein
VRFRFNDQCDNTDEPDEPRQTAPLFDRRQCIEFLKLVHDGLGRAMACTQLGLSVRSLNSTLARRANFRRALEQVEQVRADNLFAVLYAAALDGDTRAAQYLLERHSRGNRS